MTKGLDTSRFGVGGNRRRHAVLAGPWEDLCELYATLSKGVTVDAVFTESSSWQVPEGLAQEGGTSAVLSWLEGPSAVDDVYYVMGSLGRQETLRLYGLCQQRGACCQGIPPCVGLLRRRMKVENRWPAMTLTLRPEPLSLRCNRWLKRGADVLVGLCLLLTFFPLLYLVVAVVTKCRKLGPVFAEERLCGPDGKAFSCLRFRALTGKMSLAPRLFSVLCGRMSLVGPAPLQLSEADDYRRLFNRHTLRYAPKPGMKGWSVVQAGGDETGRLAQRVEADVWYAENWTPWLDLRLLFGFK